MLTPADKADKMFFFCINTILRLFLKQELMCNNTLSLSTYKLSDEAYGNVLIILYNLIKFTDGLYIQPKLDRIIRKKQR